LVNYVCFCMKGISYSNIGFLSCGSVSGRRCLRRWQLFATVAVVLRLVMNINIHIHKHSNSNVRPFN